MDNKELTPVWIKVTTVASMFSTTTQAVRNWVKKGLLKQAGTGSRLRFVTAESLKNFITTHK